MLLASILNETQVEMLFADMYQVGLYLLASPCFLPDLEHRVVKLVDQLFECVVEDHWQRFPY